MELQGKVAVVTGASSGIGQAAAEALAAHGMSVIAVARRRDRLDALAGRLAKVHAHAADVTDDDAVASLAKWVAEEFGACHVLVNCAGARLGRSFASTADIGGVRAALDVNFFGTVRCMGAFADLLAASAPSRVINVASMAGKVAVAAPGYSASKFAVVGFSEGVRPSWERRGVLVSQLNPGFVETEGFPQRHFLASPLTRRLVATPQMVAGAVVEVARSGARERSVPRWYRAGVVLRHVAAPLLWMGLSPLARRRTDAEAVKAS